ncbi:hypothetical protein GALMADRAFT_249895 [Galerina marginata CBS 339.88]|uniref:RRM domain-containing protein n=1 Tax=Galerina marginata (strain CBS 339.88) TaxID=685588 RepID=A0A067SVM8_GALM3|nr:hypothetical protein GALMADRAFT_249895 [Galerina marginata CBS 339.88]
MSTSNSKVVFVGNVPYNMTEDQLVGIFKSVGQVIGFRLVFDRDTAKPKGYGFCEFADHETALSAVRNLNNHEVGGRPLRIDLADSDPFLEGKTTVRGEILDGGYPGPSEPRSQWRGGGGSRNNDPEAFLANLPSGIQVPKGSSALDSISQTLASMPPNQLIEVLAQMKAFVITHPDQARMLLVKHPQLSYALFQALLLNKIVDSTILERMLASSRGPSAVPVAPPVVPQMAPPPIANRPPMSALPPHLQHHVPPTQYPPQMPPFPPQGLQHPQPMQAMQLPMSMSTPPPSAMFAHHQPHLAPQTAPMPTQAPFYRPPPPPAPVQAHLLPVAPQQSAPAPPKPAAPEISETQRTMLMQVLSLTQEQIDALAETERSAIMQLRTRFMGTLGST